MILSIPVGALPPGTTVSIYPVISAASLSSALPTGQSFIVSFAVSWLTPFGTSASSATPISLTITDPAIRAKDTIYDVTDSGIARVGTASGNGSATVTFSTDPIFVLAAVPNVSPQRSLRLVGKSGVELKLSCGRGVPCRGNARISVARRVQDGKRSVIRQVVLGTAKFSIPSGRTKPVALKLTANGLAALLHRQGHGRFQMSLTTTVTGGSRVVSRVYLS
jgi:hypothetical protein